MEESQLAIEDPEAFAALGLCDSSLTGVVWLEAGRDLQISLTHASGVPVTLVFTWAHALQLALQSAPRHGGEPLMWQADMSADPDGWRVALDFASTGRLEFLCTGVYRGPQA